MSYGMGMYVRRLRGKTPKQLVRTCKRNGVRTVVINGVWAQGVKTSIGVPNIRTINRAQDFVKFAKALKGEGIRVISMSYLHPEQLGKQIELWSGRALGDEGMQLVDELLIDAEVEWKHGKVSLDSVHAGHVKPGVPACFGKKFQAPNKRAKLHRRIYDLFSMMHGEFGKKPIGLTTYGAIHWHKGFPIDEFLKYRLSFVSPQVYSVSTDMYDRIFDVWRERIKKSKHNPKIVPSFPTFKQRSPRDLASKLTQYQNPVLPRVHGLLGWAWESTSPNEWRIIREFAGRLFSDGKA